MCLAMPGKLIAVAPAASDGGGADGTVDFQGSRVDVSLAFTPDARVGDWLLVHAGFAINRLDEAEAREVWDLLRHDERLANSMPRELAGSDEHGSA